MFQTQLTILRDEYWATRVDGNALMWQSIRIAAEAGLAKDVALANAVLEVRTLGCALAMLGVNSLVKFRRAILAPQMGA